jgi:hypothetical protein
VGELPRQLVTMNYRRPGAGTAPTAEATKGSRLGWRSHGDLPVGAELVIHGGALRNPYTVVVGQIVGRAP